jgi:hypothetical protein
LPSILSLFIHQLRWDTALKVHEIQGARKGSDVDVGRYVSPLIGHGHRSAILLVSTSIHSGRFKTKNALLDERSFESKGVGQLLSVQLQIRTLR